jgi:hypothetical protein
MTRRDDFSAAVIEELRQRSGGRCSVPSCRAQTTGPSESRVSGVSNVGVAAHITAAAPGGPRYDPSMTPRQRGSRENGIWVCQTHSKQIDDDESRFTADLLRAWRDRAEDLATEELGRPTMPIGTPRLLCHRVVVHPGEERKSTAHFVQDIGAVTAWGKQRTGLVRMVLYELALNAMTHGHAMEVTLRSEPGYVGMAYDGTQFGLNDLLKSNQRGGGDAIRALKAATAGALDVGYRYRDNNNEWFIVDHRQASAADDPCGLQLRPKGTGDSFSAVAGCDEIHIYADDLWSFSDVHSLAASIPEHLRERQFVVYGITSNSPLASTLRDLLVQVRFADPADV